MKKTKHQLLSALLHKYSHLVREITAQKSLFPSYDEFLKAYLKYAQRLNLLHGIYLRMITAGPSTISKVGW